MDFYDLLRGGAVGYEFGGYSGAAVGCLSVALAFDIGAENARERIEEADEASMRSLRWLVDPGDAASHSRRARLVLAMGFFFAGSAVAYLRFADHSLTKAMLAGVGAGLVGLLIANRAEDRSRRPTESGPLRHMYELVLTVIGVGLLVGGLVTSERDVAVSGLPFLTIALALFLLKRLAAQRRRSGG